MSIPFTQKANTLAFGPFEIDLPSRQLRKHGIRIRVPDQPFQVLLILMERPGTLVTREELKRHLWTGQEFGDFDHGLNAAVNRLRAALGDSAGTPQYIETHSKQGYRFLANVERKAVPEPALPIVGTPRRPWDGWLPWAIAATIAASLLIAAALFLRSNPPDLAELQQVTRDLGLTMNPDVSADGRLLVYASDRAPDQPEAKQSQGRSMNIWIQQLSPSGKATRLTHLDSDALEPSFHPDGGSVVFRSSGVFSVPVIGGEPAQLSAFGRNPHYSPDGNKIAFWAAEDDLPPGFEPGIFWMDARGGKPERIGPPHTGYPIWSPDSRRVLAFRTRPDPMIDWWLIDVPSGKAVPTGALSTFRKQGLAVELNTYPKPSIWRAGGRIAFSARQGDGVNIWEVLLDGDRLHKPAYRLTSGTAVEVSPALTSTGRLFFAATNEQVGIWSLPFDASRGQVQGPLKRMTQGKASEVTHSISRNSRLLAYTALADKIPTLRVFDLPSAKEIGIAMSGGGWHPIFSADGTRVAYTVRDRSDAGVYVLSLPRGVPVKVSDATGFVFDWSADQRHLLCVKKTLNEVIIWEVDTEKKTQRMFLRDPGGALFQTKYSPDYRWLTMLRVNAGRSSIEIVPLVNGEPASADRWIPVTPDKIWCDKPRWSPDGNMIYFLWDRDGHRCVWAQRLDPTTKRPAGDSFAVFHSHELPFSIGRLPTGMSEIEITQDRLWLNLAESSGNIWSVQVPR